MNSIQRQIEERGMELFRRVEGETPEVFRHRGLTGRALDWSMQDEELKTQLLRFVDVLPSLKSAREIAGHAEEYLGRNGSSLPWLVRWGIRTSSLLPWIVSAAAKGSVGQIARLFIVAPTVREAIEKLRALRAIPMAFTADILGETVVSEREAELYQGRYLKLIEELARDAAHWPSISQIDEDDRGPLPKANVSVKISALYSQIHPADPEGNLEHLLPRLRAILWQAKERGVFINLDMETTALKELTFELFRRLLREPMFQEYDQAGIALQAYLRSSEADLIRLIDWAKAEKRRITVRLIKGAYWDYEWILSQQRGWPVPVFQHKAETDANYEKLAGILLANHEHIRCAFGTHCIRSMASCLVQAERTSVPPNHLEFQMLYGMAEPIKRALVQMGCRVRDYCPIGEILPGMSYLVRRLLENTSNQGFLRAAYLEEAKPIDLLQDPAAQAAGLSKETKQTLSEVAPVERPEIEPVFRNEPATDFTQPQNRERMAEALREARRELGRPYPAVINGQSVRADRELISRNPARPDEIIGRVAKTGLAEAEQAVAAAHDAFKSWSEASVEERAGVLERAAEILRAERFRFAAWEVFETGKNWIESDADVAEAIDFCVYYSREMRRLAGQRRAIPGEINEDYYVGRGVCAVIAPWNFPLAILCGMTAAALVAGNSVVMKPAEQASVVGALFMDVLRRAGLPDGAANYLPGAGSEIGEFLVRHPRVAVIAFTGSREVGERIYEWAGQTRPGQLHLKKVICEMGGKNAVLLDSDADLDEAIPGVLSSAFGYQGQKCSALSRLIVIEDIYERLLSRLIDAARSLRVGPPEDPATVVGPLIDARAFERVQSYVALGKSEAVLAFQGAVPFEDGYFVGPAIFRDVPPAARIAQEEIFGPVLCVLRARDLEEALQWANGTEFALTGGFYSRSPAHIEQVKRAFQVGNLYINRPITGALVGRHPFGGFRMSGGGTKAGGPDYLLNFVYPRVVTENLMRRGFAPEVD